MKRLSILALVFGCIAVTASAVDAYGRLANEDFVGHRFILTAVNGAAPSSEKEIYFQVDENSMISGKICNVFRGHFEIMYDRIHMKDAVSSRMACPDAALTNLENRFLALMERGMVMIPDGDRLTLRRDDLSLVFMRYYGLYAPDGASAEKADSPADGEGAAAVEADDLVGKKFILKKMSGEDFVVEGERKPFIEFADGLRVMGATCNNFTGPGKLENNVLTVENAAATMKMCVDEKLNKLERDLFALLRKGAAITLDGDTLTLKGDDIELTYELE